MLAQLIQALYNIVDRFFVGRYSAGALTNVVFDPLLRLFSNSAQVRQIGLTAFLIIGCSFFLRCFRGCSRCFSRLGLGYAWLAFPIAGTVTAVAGLALYRRELRRWRSGAQAPAAF